MPVTLTSPALGKQVGDSHTGPEEDWLLANGYAERDGYTGPGVSNTGATGVTPDKDLLLAENREAPGDGYDFDLDGVDDDPAVVDAVEPDNGLAAGGEKVTITGSGLEDVTAVTFGGTAATNLDVVSDTELTVTAPAHAAGEVDVVLTDSEGATTATAAYTYA